MSSKIRSQFIPFYNKRCNTKIFLKRVSCNLKNEILPVLLLVYDNSLGVLTRKNSQMNSHYKIDKSNIF